MRLSDVSDCATTNVLMSMDIFLSGYRKAQLLADDKIALEKIALQQQWKHRLNFAEQLFNNACSILVTTPQMKIMFASSGITQLTGYLPKEVIGHTPQLFQGEKTDPEIREAIRRSVEKQIGFTESIINYRKDGSMYYCHIKALPLFNRHRELVNFIAFEKEMISTL